MKEKLKDYAPILLVIVCAAVVGILLATHVIDLDTIPELVRDNHLSALLIILALYILKGCSGVIIYNAIVIMVSLLFPIWEALIINAVGTAVALSVSYLIGSRVKTGGLEELLSKHPKIARYFIKTKEYGFVACFAIHLLNLSMEVLGLIFGMLRIGYLPYLISSWLAIIPGMICVTVMGNTWDVSNPVFWIVLCIDLVLILFGWWYMKNKVVGNPAQTAGDQGE